MIGIIYGLSLNILINMGNKIMPSLKEIMENTPGNEKIAILVHLSEKPDYKKIKNLPPEEYVEFLKNFSENSQRDILNYLNQNFKDKISDLKTFWIFNGFYLKAKKEVIERIAQREDVEYIIGDFVLKIGDAILADGGGIDGPEWNISWVRADSCWMAGYTGEGVIIGHMDTGVDISHPALQGKVNVKIINITGRTVKKFSFLPVGKYLKRIDLSNLPEGIYILKLKTSYFQKKKKIIILK